MHRYQMWRINNLHDKHECASSNTPMQTSVSSTHVLTSVYLFRALSSWSICIVFESRGLPRKNSSFAHAYNTMQDHDLETLCTHVDTSAISFVCLVCKQVRLLACHISHVVRLFACLISYRYNECETKEANNPYSYLHLGRIPNLCTWSLAKNLFMLRKSTNPTLNLAPCTHLHSGLTALPRLRPFLY